MFAVHIALTFFSTDLEIKTVGISWKQSLSISISRFVSSTLHDFFFIPRIEMWLSADFGVEPVGLTDSKDWAHLQGFMPLLAGYITLGKDVAV